MIFRHWNRMQMPAALRPGQTRCALVAGWLLLIVVVAAGCENGTERSYYQYGNVQLMGEPLDGKLVFWFLAWQRGEAQGPTAAKLRLGDAVIALDQLRPPDLEAHGFETHGNAPGVYVLTTDGDQSDRLVVRFNGDELAGLGYGAVRFEQLYQLGQAQPSATVFVDEQGNEIVLPMDRATAVELLGEPDEVVTRMIEP